MKYINPDDLTSKGWSGDSYWNAKDIGKIISKKAVEFIIIMQKKILFSYIIVPNAS